MIRTYLRDGEPGAAGGGVDDPGQQDSGGDSTISRAEYEALAKRFEATKIQKKRLEEAQASIEQRKADEAKALDQRALEEAREYEKLKTQLQAEAAQAIRDRDSVRAEYEARFMVLRDGVVNDRVVNLFMSDLLACETSEESAIKWAEIKADPENAIFFAQQQATPEKTPPQAPPPGTAAAGRHTTGADLNARLKSTDLSVRRQAQDEAEALYQTTGKLPD